MARGSLPPSPIGASDWRQWADKFVGWMRDQGGDEAENLPQSLVMPHQMPKRVNSAKVPGALMFDPVTMTPIFSDGAAWKRLMVAATAADHPLSDAFLTVDVNTINPPSIRPLARVLQEIIARLNEVENR